MSHNDEIQEQLSQLAMNHSRPFCYTCYRTAPTGRCVTCGSDDLMREVPGVGVEYGGQWHSLMIQAHSFIDQRSELRSLV